MTTGQTVEMKVIVDAVMASDQLKALNTRLSELEKLATRAGGALPQVEKGSSAAASKMLILGQAVDDAQYGLRGVVNNMPQVVQAFGGGLGLAGAVGIAAVAVSQLYDAYKAYDAIQQETTRNLGAWRGGLDDVDKLLREGVNKRTADLTQLLKDAQTELRNFGKTSKEIREEEARAAVAATERQLETLTRNLPELQEKARGQRTALFYTNKEEFERVTALEEVASRAVQRQTEYTKQLAEQRATLDQIVKTNAETKAKEDAAEAAKRADGETFKFGERDSRYSSQALQERIKRAIGAQQAEEEARRRETEAAMSEIVNDEQKFADQEKKIFEDAEKAKTAIAKREAEERAKIAEAEHKAQVEGLTAFATSAATALGTFAGQLATGQEAALENLLSAAAVHAGGMVTLEGGKVLAAGIGGALLGNPAAPGQIAGGLGLVAAGSAIQAGGPAAVQALLGAASGASPSSATSAARDRGASPRASSNTGGGGPLVLNIAYGVAGPLPEDTAREVARAMRTGARRRGAA